MDELEPEKDLDEVEADEDLEDLPLGTKPKVPIDLDDDSLDALAEEEEAPSAEDSYDDLDLL